MMRIRIQGMGKGLAGETYVIHRDVEIDLDAEATTFISKALATREVQDITYSVHLI